jgi:uncharacterized membrane protein SpoIIM required for sporulation
LHVTNLDEFVSDRSPTWIELEQLLAHAGNRPSRLGADGIRRLGACYRASAADLAHARRRFPGDAIVGRLEQLVQRGRQGVYNAPSSRLSVWEFFATGYWRRVRERKVILAISFLALVIPSLLGGYWAWRDPGPASGLVPTQYQSVTEPRTPGQSLGKSVDEESALAAQIFTNNIGVTFYAFAGGLLLGLGSLYVLLFNGLLLGVVAGLAIGAGNGQVFFELVSAHGVLELSCIIVSGAAGLRLGWAIIDPGNRTRGEALRQEARAAIELVLGTAPWLVLAGLVEGFLTPAGAGLTTALAVGLSLGAVYWGLVLWRGAPSDSLADPRASVTVAPET